MRQLLRGRVIRTAQSLHVEYLDELKNFERADHNRAREKALSAVVDPPRLLPGLADDNLKSLPKLLIHQETLLVINSDSNQP